MAKFYFKTKCSVGLRVPTVASKLLLDNVILGELDYLLNLKPKIAKIINCNYFFNNLWELFLQT